MLTHLRCPNCGSDQLNLCNYESMIVISSEHALFALSCPDCSAKISTVQQIPPQLQEEVASAAWEVGAGMGYGH